MLNRLIPFFENPFSWALSFLLFICFLTLTLAPLLPELDWIRWGGIAAGAVIFAQWRNLLSGDLRRLWVWPILSVFCLGGFLKQAVVARILMTPQELGAFFAEIWHITPTTVAMAQQDLFIGFLVFSAAIAVTKKNWRIFENSQSQPPTYEPLSRKWFFTLWFLGLLILVLTALFQVETGFGIMGVESAELPLRLGTIAVRLRKDILPTYLLWLGWRTMSREDHSAQLTLWLIGLSGIVEAFLSTARGAIVFALLPWIGIQVLQKQPIRKILGSFFAMIVLTFALFPVLSSVRGAVMAQSGLKISEAIQLKIFEPKLLRNSLKLGETATWFDIVEASAADTAQRVALRFLGADGLWLLNAKKVANTPADLTFKDYLNPGTAPTYTGWVINGDVESDFRSPGSLAFFKMSFGESAWPFVFALTLLVLFVIWQWVATWTCAVPAIISLTFFLLIQFNEGTWSWKELVSIVFRLCLIVLLTAVAQRFLQKPRTN